MGDSARIGLDASSQNTEQGGLSAAVEPHDTDSVALIHRHRHVVEHRRDAAGHGDGIRRDERAYCCH